MSSLLPVTALVAIVIFLLKEFFESYRRELANERRLNALRKLIAIEIERNFWTIKSLRGHLSNFSDIFKNGGRINIVKNEYKKAFIEYLDSGYSGGISGSAFPQTHRKVVESSLQELAVLDQTNFAKLLDLYDAVLDLQHVSDSLFDNILEYNGENISYFPKSDFFESFIDYANEELNDFEKIFASYYLICTGNKLATHRLR